MDARPVLGPRDEPLLAAVREEVAQPRDLSGFLAEYHYISDRSWTRREVLLKKNSRLTRFSRRYVSAEHPSNAGEGESPGTSGGGSERGPSDLRRQEELDPVLCKDPAGAGPMRARRRFLSTA